MLTAEKITAIDHALIKDLVMREIKLSNLREMRRSAGNTIKRLGVDVTIDEYIEYGEMVVREVFEEELAKGIAGKTDQG